VTVKTTYFRAVRWRKSNTINPDTIIVYVIINNHISEAYDETHGSFPRYCAEAEDYHVKKIIELQNLSFEKKQRIVPTKKV